MADKMNTEYCAVGKVKEGCVFSIPDYQRPYEWDAEDGECEKMWDDLTEHFEVKGKASNSDYFLGSIVICEGKADRYEIIDGRQRITTLMLMFRAFYEKCKDNKGFEDYLKKLSAQLWMIKSGIGGDKPLFNKRRLNISDETEKIEFEKIMAQELQLDAPKSKYQENYIFFWNKIKNLSDKELVIHIEGLLKKCFLLVVTCDNTETALTIFNTLNTRGRPLCDSDIFKAKMLQNAKSKDCKSKIKSFFEKAHQKVGLEIDSIFRYYSHYLRGKGKITSKEKSLRDFYLDNKAQNLQKPDIILDHLNDLLDFWDYVQNNLEKLTVFEKTLDFESRKWLHCLKVYPIESWKYAVSTYVLKYKFKKFAAFLKKLTILCYYKALVDPGEKKIKQSIYKICVNLFKSDNFSVEIDLLPEDKDFIRAGKSKYAKGLVLLHSYLKEKKANILKLDFEVEHILPVKWQKANYAEWTENDAKDLLETLGNKIALEKSINGPIQNFSFKFKKEGEKNTKGYKDSQYAEVKDFYKKYKNEKNWLPEDVRKRNKNFQKNIIQFLGINDK
jgi:uncharacterized protein with ParB-like and HNH nuclease domain